MVDQHPGCGCNCRFASRRVDSCPLCAGQAARRVPLVPSQQVAPHLGLHPQPQRRLGLPRPATGPVPATLCRPSLMRCLFHPCFSCRRPEDSAYTSQYNTASLQRLLYRSSMFAAMRFALWCELRQSIVALSIELHQQQQVTATVVWQRLSQA